MFKHFLILSAASLISTVSLAQDYLWSKSNNPDEVIWVGLGADYISSNYEGKGFDPYAIQLQLQYQRNNWRHEIYGSTGLDKDVIDGYQFRFNAAYGYMIGFSESLDNQLIATLSAGVGALDRTVNGATIHNFSPVWKFSLEEDINNNPGWRMFLEGGGYYEGKKNRTLHVGLGIKRALSF